MEFTNSKLVNYTKISPNKTVNRKHEIDTITIHCVVGQLSVQSLGSVFASSKTQSSSNYGIGYDGSIGMYVEEKDRSWCSSSASNDHRAITIEVASDKTHPYAVNAKAYAALIELLVDICQRNNIKELKWKADKSLIGQVDKQNMTVHRWFANKSCPGEYLYSRMGEIAAEVNKKLNPVIKPIEKPVDKPVVESEVEFKAGDHVKLTPDAVYTNGKKVPNWVKNKEWVVKKVNGDVVTINEEVDGDHAINSNVKANFLTIVKTEVKPADKPVEKVEEFKPYTVQVTASTLNVRKGPGVKYAVKTTIRDKGVYTIVAESNDGWGKLKSGAGWISLKYTKKI